MRYTTLGQTGLRVSRVCFGTWQISGDWGSVAAEEFSAAVRKAVDVGVNFFDTAQAYGFGRSEAVLGEALRPEIDSRRDEVVIATKGGLRPQGGGAVRDSSEEWLREGLEESLRQLGVDHVDLYQVHWPDPAIPIEETAGVVDAFVREGKVRHIGVSNYDRAQIQQFASVRPVETVQPPYHMFRRSIEDEILPFCEEQNIGVLAYAPLAHGLLTGRWTPETRFDADDWRSTSPVFQGEAFEQNLRIVARLEEVAKRRDCTVAQLAVAWVLANSAVHVAIVGARNPDQVAGSAPGADVELSAGDLEEIEEILADAVPVGGKSPEGDLDQ